MPINWDEIESPTKGTPEKTTGINWDEIKVEPIKSNIPSPPAPILKPYLMPALLSGAKYDPTERTIFGDIFERPGAAIRSTLRGEGYGKGAIAPGETPSFQEDWLKRYYGTGSPSLLKTLGGFGVSTAGMAADIATNPADLLLTLTGTKAFQQLGKSGQAVKQITQATEKVVPEATKIYAQNIGISKKALEGFAENLNLKTFPTDARQAVKDIVSTKPEIGRTPVVSDVQLVKMASELKDTPTINALKDLPEGQLAAEALKIREGNVDLIRKSLNGELSTLKSNLDGLIENGLATQRRTAAELGRGLRQQQLPASTQTDLAFQIENTIKRIKKDPILKHDTDLINSINKLKQTVVSKEFNPTAWNKAYYIWQNSILSNPFTHLANTGSNTLFSMSKIPEKFLSSIWDVGLSLRTGKRTQYFGEIPAMVRGLLTGKLPQELKTVGSKIEQYSEPIQGVAGKVVGLPMKALGWEDDLTKTLVGKMELAAGRYAGKTGDELLNSVKAEQLMRTWQNEPNRLAQGLLRFRANVPGTRWVVPFIKTPANLIQTSLERTPLVAGKILYKAGKGTYNQAELAKDLGNLTMGSLLATWVADQHSKGRVTGKAPTNPGERDAFYRQGKKPNAIQVGNKWIPLDRVEPFGSSFSMIANLIQDYQKSDSDIPSEKVMSAIGGLTKTMTNKTYLSGMTNFIKATSDPELYGTSWIKKIASGAIPGGLKFFAEMKDPYYREADTALDMLKSRIPGVSETLPPKLNVFGEPVKKDRFNIGTIKESQLEKAITETPVGFPSKTLGKEKLKPEEYRSVIQESGPVIKGLLTVLSQNPQFEKLPIEVREKIVTRIVSEAREAPRAKVRVKNFRKY